MTQPHRDTYGARQAIKRQDIVNNVNEAIGHILWTIQRSPQTYAYFRKELIGLRQMLVNAELKYRELEDA